MGVNDRITALIRNWLNVRESNVNKTILIEDHNDIQVTLFKNELWYRGDISELQQFYNNYDDGAGNTSFWKGKSTNGINFRKIHTGLPGLIVDKLVDIVVDDMNDINIYTGKDEKGNPTKNVEAMERWETIAKEHDFKDKVLKDAVKWALLGEAVFKLSYDNDVSNYPLIEVVSGKDVEYEYKRGRNIATKFYFPKMIDKKPYVLEETYEKGGVRYKLFDEGGKEATTSMIEQLYDLYPFVYDEPFIMAVPFILNPNSKYPGRGRGLLESKEGAFDSLDEAWSQWMDALRDGRTKTYVPEELIPRDKNTGKLYTPNTFDSRFIAIGSDKRETADNKIQVESPDIRADKYLSTYITALDLCLQGIISPSTLGIDNKKLDNAEAQREKEKTTLYTRGKIVRALEKVVPQLVELVLKVDDMLNERTLGKYDVSVDFGEYANPSFEAQVETIGNARAQGIMSIEKAIDELYGDSLTEEERKEEVDRLKIELGFGIEEPKINEFDGKEEDLNVDDEDEEETA